MDLKELEKQLQDDRLCHIDMIDCLRRGLGQVKKADERGILLYNTGSDQYHITARESSFLKEAVELCEPGRTVICHQEAFLDEMEEQLGLNRMDFYHGVYSHKAPPPKKGEEPEIRTLDSSWLDVISPQYYDGEERERLAFVLKQGELFGAFVEGELAGFVGCHPEGAYGILEVLPKFRRRGIGYALERYVIQWLLERGRIPYCQISPDNKASLALQGQLGLELSHQVVHWLYA